MLTVKCSGGIGGKQHILEGINLIVIEDIHGNPLVVVMETQPGVQTVILADDPDFNRILTSLGIDKTVITDSADSQHAIPQGAKVIQAPSGFNPF